MRFLFYTFPQIVCIALPFDWNPYSNIIAGIGGGSGPAVARWCSGAALAPAR